MAAPRFSLVRTSLLIGIVLSPLAGCTGKAQTAAAPSPDSRYPSTEADARFMTNMIRHHGQALVMAGYAPTNGASPAVRRLAERIIGGQRDEIATMQRWLEDRGLPLPSGHDMGHAHHMPGMLTADQLEQLAEAKGPEFDRLFLTFMIQHHRGAVAMVKQLFNTPGAGQEDAVFKFASDANVDQTTEIARMERMLSALQAGEPAS